VTEILREGQRNTERLNRLRRKKTKRKKYKGPTNTTKEDTKMRGVKINSQAKKIFRRRTMRKKRLKCSWDPVLKKGDLGREGTS